ncbi:ribosomal-protein-serine acetyltransferase [Bacillus oleivorans]|uniref:Ribosomal-protein-serine acetyltransferase n=1 Tax=Bacillus oleivorans TaxID=1448271 RepID=A0A285CJ96_9BACI|nr:GNAT family protein [Bacillus oleivorans]SNX67088.1 ribosomal-protein-serine acetyltransferase [Bacillus oleivorans]
MIIIFYIDVDENLKLKLLLKQDSIKFFELIKKNDQHLVTFMPRIKENNSVEDSEKVIDLFLNQLLQNNGFRTGIFYKDILIGIIGPKYIDWQNRKTEIMYWVDKEYLGRGIATKCTLKVLDIVFNYYGLNKAMLKISVENKASIKIAEKCGFVLEGISKEDELLDDGYTDVLNYSIFNKKA